MLETKAIIKDNIFDVIKYLLALWKTLRYDRTEKKNLTCFPGLVRCYLEETKCSVDS